MPLLVFVKRGKRLGEFLTIPYTLIDEVLSLSDVPAYVSPIHVSGVSAVLLTPAQVKAISVRNTDAINSDVAALVSSIVTSTNTDVDVYLAILPNERSVVDSDVVFANASILVDQDILENITDYSSSEAVYTGEKHVAQKDLDVTFAPVYAPNAQTRNNPTKFNSTPISSDAELVGQSVQKVTLTPVQHTKASVSVAYTEASLTAIVAEHRSVTYTLFWLPPVPVQIATSLYAQQMQTKSDFAITSSAIVGTDRVSLSHSEAISSQVIAHAIEVQYAELTPIQHVPRTFSSAISLKVIFPESGAVASEAYSAFIVMALQRDTGSCGAYSVSSDSLCLSLSTTTNPVSSTATA